MPGGKSGSSLVASVAFWHGSLSLEPNRRMAGGSHGSCPAGCMVRRWTAGVPTHLLPSANSFAASDRGLELATSDRHCVTMRFQLQRGVPLYLPSLSRWPIPPLHPPSSFVVPTSSSARIKFKTSNPPTSIKSRPDLAHMFQGGKGEFACDTSKNANIQR